MLTSLVSGLANATRMEETTSWRYPVDLVQILEAAFEQLPSAIEAGQTKQDAWLKQGEREKQDELVPILLGEDAAAIAQSLLTALQSGCTAEQLAAIVTYAAALRVAQI